MAPLGGMPSLSSMGLSVLVGGPSAAPPQRSNVGASLVAPSESRLPSVGLMPAALPSVATMTSSPPDNSVGVSVVAGVRTATLALPLGAGASLPTGSSGLRTGLSLMVPSGYSVASSLPLSRLSIPTIALVSAGSTPTKPNGPPASHHPIMLSPPSPLPDPPPTELG
jgi:hypothetical protein